MPLTNFKSPALLVILLITLKTSGSDLDTVGATLLHQVDPTLQGNGIPVAQPEGYDGAVGAFEVAPFVVGQPTNLFTWISSNGTAGTFPNSVGTLSSHAN